MTPDPDLKGWACPRCWQRVRPFARWRGSVLVAVGWACPSTECGYRVAQPAWHVGVA